MTKEAAPAESGEPIFLVGALRSGSTMLRLMLNNHPDITFVGELEYVAPVISDEGDFPTLEDYYSYLQSHYGFLLDKPAIDKKLSFPELCHSFLTQHQQVRKTSFIGATVHNHFSRLPFLWPKARYIKLIRDGRDVARSFIPMGWAGNVWKGVEHWIESEREWSYLKTKLPKSSWIEIKYEEIIENPEIQLSILCKFIGVPFRKEMLDYPQNSTYGAPDPALAYQWKSKQSETEIRLLESRIGEMLKEHGYELSGLPSLKINSFAIYKLELLNKIYRWRFRTRQYGLTLSASELLARKLKLKRWHQQVKVRINQISIQNMK